MAKSDTVKIILRGETLHMGTPKKPEVYGDGETVPVPSDLAERLIAAKRAELAPTSAKVAPVAAEPDPVAATPDPVATGAPTEPQG